MSKLAERRAQYGIPPLVHYPMGKNVVVFRLPEEERTAGGLYVPTQAAEPKYLGVLLAAGLTALDSLYDHGVEVGDIVQFGKWAGWEKEARREEGAEGKRVLDMKVEDISGSVDLIERVESGALTIRRDPETGEHEFVRSAHE